jgi:membrane-associated phospholipid phosphatase
MLGVCLWLLLKDRQAYERMAKMFVFGFSFSLIFFLILPNGQNLRLESFERENIFTDIIATLWAGDTHTNVLPSMHVYGSFITIFATLDTKTINRWLKCGSAALGILISIATCTIKQHSILDLFAGCILFAILYWIIYHNKIFKNYDGSIEYISEFKGEYLMFKQFV